MRKITYKNIKKVYRWLMLTAFLFMVIIGPVCESIFGGSGAIFAPLFGIGFLLFIVANVLEIHYWRCPFCHESFARGITMEAQVCPYCKKELHLDD